MPVGTSPDIHRVAWSYVVAMLEELEAGGNRIQQEKAQLLAVQLRNPRDMVALTDSLLQLAVQLWNEAHEGDVHAALEDARTLAIDMAGSP